MTREQGVDRQLQRAHPTQVAERGQGAVQAWPGAEIGNGNHGYAPHRLGARRQPLPMQPSHQPVPNELERAYRTAKQLAEQLEVANQVVLQRLALYIRGQIAEQLASLETEVVPPTS